MTNTNSYIHMKRFDSSRTPGRGPLNVQIGVGQVIKGNFSSFFIWIHRNAIILELTKPRPLISWI